MTAAAPVLAQDQDQDQAASAIEEIVVTGRKRGAEILQDIPTSITAINSDMMEKLGVDDFVDFAYQVPGLTFQDTGPGEKRYIIRGVASAGQQQVAQYFDEVPLPGVQSSTSNSGSQTTDLKIYDMERIEVLRGPQGTTFGANSQTGTIRFVLNKPDLFEWEGSAKAELSSTRFGDENYNVAAMANFPIVEGKFAARLVAYIGEDSGFIDNVRLNRNNINWVETTGVRGMLRWQATETLTLDAMVWAQERNNGGDFTFMPFDSFSQDSDPNGIGDRDNVAPVALFQTGRFKVGDYTFTGKPDDQFIASVTANWDLDFANLTATGSFYSRDFDFKFDSSWILFFLGVGPEGAVCPSGDPCVRPDLFPAMTNQAQDVEQKAFEIRMNSTNDSRLQWLGGFFFRDRESNFQSFVPVTNDDGELFDPGTPFVDDPFAVFPNPVGAGIPGCHPCVFARIANKDIEEIALFGEASYAITDQFEALVGLRWFQLDSADFGATVFPFALFPPDPDAEAPFTQNAKEDKLIKKFQLSWKPTEDATLFALASQGFRLGGTNNQGVADIPPLFESDDIWNFEVGWKTQWLDRRIVINGSVFHLLWDNLQVLAQDDTGAFGFVTNAGEAAVTGVELEIFASPTPEWDLTFGLSWLPKKELTADQVAIVEIGGVETELFAPGRDGDQIPTIPKITLNGTLQYNYDLPLEGWTGWLRAEASYRSDSHSQLVPFEDGNANDRPLDGYGLLNLRAGFQSEGFNGSIVVFATNVTDTRADIAVFAGNGEPTRKVTARPRTVGIEVRKRF